MQITNIANQIITEQNDIKMDDKTGTKPSDKTDIEIKMRMTIRKCIITLIQR